MCKEQLTNQTIRNLLSCTPVGKNRLRAGGGGVTLKTKPSVALFVVSLTQSRIPHPGEDSRSTWPLGVPAGDFLDIVM